MGFEQFCNTGSAALARREQQRRKAPERPILRARFRGDPPRPVPHRLAGIDVGAVGYQKLHHAGLILGAGPHERRLSTPLFSGVDLGAVRHQDLGGLDDVRARHGHQGCLTVRIG